MSQNIVMLDAVGTSIYPFPPVVEAYCRIAANHQIELSKKRIKRRFYEASRRYFHNANLTSNLPCNDESDWQRWNSVVREIFRTRYSDQLFHDLWNYFACPDAWRCYGDVEILIENLQQNGFTVGLASNFDSRLKPIIQSLLPLIPDEMIFYSTEIGFAKPDVRFFKTIERRLTLHSDPPRILMIGDNWALDVEAAHRSGWNAIWKSGTVLPDLQEIQSYFLRRT